MTHNTILLLLVQYRLIFSKTRQNESRPVIRLKNKKGKQVRTYKTLRGKAVSIKLELNIGEKTYVLRNDFHRIIHMGSVLLCPLDNGKPASVQNRPVTRVIIHSFSLMLADNQQTGYIKLSNIQTGPRLACFASATDSASTVADKLHITCACQALRRLYSTSPLVLSVILRVSKSFPCCDQTDSSHREMAIWNKLPITTQPQHKQ